MRDWIVVAAVGGAVLGDCAQQSSQIAAPHVSTPNSAGSGTNDPLSAAARLPPNYRQLIAQYIRARNRYVIREAKITKPYERWRGVLSNGGTMPAVCVAIFRDNPFGIVVRDNWVVTIENGQVRPITMGLESCSDLSPFTELTQQA